MSNFKEINDLIEKLCKHLVGPSKQSKLAIQFQNMNKKQKWYLFGYPLFVIFIDIFNVAN